ncbi:MAG: hypothetical protein WA418_30905, partial [Bradyrhizobium sp.]
ATICYLTAVAGWMMLFRLARYATAIEVIGSFVLAMATVSLSLRFRIWPWFAPLAPVFALVFALTSYPDWGRGSFTKSILEFHSPPIKPGTLVLFIDVPEDTNQLSYLAAAIGPHAIYAQPTNRLIEPGDGTGLSQRIKVAIATAANIAVFSFRHRGTKFRDDALRRVGLCPSEDDVPVHGSMAPPGIIVFVIARPC